MSDWLLLLSRPAHGVFVFVRRGEGITPSTERCGEEEASVLSKCGSWATQVEWWPSRMFLRLLSVGRWVGS